MLLLLSSLLLLSLITHFMLETNKYITVFMYLC